jgi:hypothetical protein
MELTRRPQAIRKQLSERLMVCLKQTGDPRVIGGGEKFEAYPCRGPAGAGRKPK